MPRITPNLWFDDEGEEAAEFYVSVFPNSKITNVTHYGEAGPRPAGTRADRRLRARRPGVHRHQRRPAVHLRRGDLAPDQLRRPGRGRLLLGRSSPRGGEEGPCGWLKDSYGLSWQVVPGRLAGAAERPRPGASAAGHEGDVRHEEARHRRAATPPPTVPTDQTDQSESSSAAGSRVSTSPTNNVPSRASNVASV